VKPPAVGGVVALAVVLVDQIAKAGVLAHFDRSGIDPSPLGPFLNLTLQMNRGISFSLFARDSASAQVALLALTFAVVGLLTWWLFRSRSVLPAAGLGLIIGGAMGNAIDRLAHGAVVDYLDLHAFGRHFFVFDSRLIARSERAEESKPREPAPWRKLVVAVGPPAAGAAGFNEVATVIE